MDQTIEIKCEASQYIPLDEFVPLQGDLKSLSEDDYVKLRNSITEYGFSFPVFYWQDESGKKWIIDSHQRNYVLKKMRDEGWTIPALPADRIIATDIREAKKKLLLLNSRYGKITDQGLADFMSETGAEVEMEDIGYLLSLDADFNTLWEGSDKEENGEEKTIECPECHAKFALPK